MIRKILFILSISVGYYSVASAQALTKEDLDHSDIYFRKNSGELVSEKDSADYIRIILPPDSSDLNLYVVKDFYTNGKPKLIGKSIVRFYDLKRQGMFIEYFANGRRGYENGIQTGDVVNYYPNGKFYYTYNFDKDLKLNIITAAGDSTGSTLAENGNGTWIEYDDNFKFVKGTGPIKKGLKDGEWHGAPNDSLKYVCTYSKGISISGTSYDKSGKEHHFTKDVVLPEYKGGMEKFYNFVGRTVHYTKDAKENNIQGKVYVVFNVEKGGQLTHIKILRSLGHGLDEEALHVISLCPPWTPEYDYGVPVSAHCILPISFSLRPENY